MTRLPMRNASSMASAMSSRQRSVVATLPMFFLRSISASVSAASAVAPCMEA